MENEPCSGCSFGSAYWTIRVQAFCSALNVQPPVIHVEWQARLVMGFLRKVMLFIHPGSPRAGSNISIPIKAWLGALAEQKCVCRERIMQQCMQSGLRAPHAGAAAERKQMFVQSFVDVIPGGCARLVECEMTYPCQASLKPSSCGGPPKGCTMR
jgi:hypothetical protein